MNINKYSKINFCSRFVSSANSKRINSSLISSTISGNTFAPNKILTNQSINWFKNRYTELLKTLNIESNTAKLKQIVELALKDYSFVNELLACKVGKTDTKNIFFRDINLINQLEETPIDSKLENKQNFDRIKDEYSIDDMENLVNAKKIDEDLTRNLMAQTITIDGKLQKRFSTKSINDIVQLAQKDKNFALELINFRENNKYRIQPDTIITILKNIPQNKKLMEEILYKKNDDKSSSLFNKYEYNTSDIEKLALASLIDAEYTKDLMHTYAQNIGSRYLSRRFNAQEIYSLIDLTVFDKDLVNKLINTSSYEKSFGINKPTYYPADISWIISTAKINSNMTKTLLGFNDSISIPLKTFSPYKIQNIVKNSNSATIFNNIKIACKELREQKYDDNEISKILTSLTKDLTLFEDKNTILNNVLKVSDYSSAFTSDIISTITSSNVKLAKKISVEKNFPKKDIAPLLKSYTDEQKDFINILIENKHIPRNKILEILNTTIINDANNDGGNNGKIDSHKIKKYTHLFQNQKLGDWMEKMLDGNFDIETISKLAPTKLSLLQNKAVEASRTNNQQNNNAHDIGLGVNLNPLLAKNIETLNKMSAEECTQVYNSNIRKQLTYLITKLSDDTKEYLKAQKIYTDNILKKLNYKFTKTNNNKIAKRKSEFRSKSKIKGFERIVVDKYEPIETIWQSEEATKKWAEEKYLSMRNCEYISTRNTSENTNLAVKVTKKRKEILNEWYNFIETDTLIKNNPFIKVILCDFITRGLEPERSTLPPVLDKDIVKQILAETSNYSNFSINNSYTNKINEFSKKNSLEEAVDIDGIKGTWYTVPKTDSSSPDFKSNVSKIQSFSYGTNWCIRTWKAEPYIQKGNMHFFVDNNGLTQICVREEGNSGEVYEIQKRQQDQSAPVAYLDVIQSFMQKRNLTPLGYCKKEFEKAIEQKPEYDKLKTELDIYKKNKQYKNILERMGIRVNVLADGTFELSHYCSYINNFSLNDFGINENLLLSNVSKIKGNANFNDSNATTLPTLREVGGELNFGYTNISNVKNLKSINGKEIIWK